MTVAGLISNNAGPDSNLLYIGYYYGIRTKTTRLQDYKTTRLCVSLTRLQDYKTMCFVNKKCFFVAKMSWFWKVP